MSDRFEIIPQVPPAHYRCGRCGASQEIIKAPRDKQEAQYQAFHEAHKDCKWGKNP